ncbi:PLDc N-terminal domain-containing protein [Nesterenkonia lutea]|uniref:Cardiolipin synthase N-terminal domain-containing protein n=1 Tax=Nesterenkonia lutea TaxID=272919 RepID=A0ABR9JGY0_9MICC|nr:PLD nuclease N-terminal domain-containing protein [Nesterenkonia lutea]MBE1525101.1 hypothetical protein [Nesterenkonia lutea]
MNPSVIAGVLRPLAEDNAVWAWALAVTAIGLLIAALMVLVQDTEMSGRGRVLWGFLVFALPILGPAAYLGWSTIEHRRTHGRHEKGPVEKYAPEEAAEHRDAARRGEQNVRDADQAQ